MSWGTFDGGLLFIFYLIRFNLGKGGSRLKERGPLASPDQPSPYTAMASGAPANPAGGTDDDCERPKALTRDKGKEKIMPVRKGGGGGGGEEAEAAAVEGNGVTCGICLAEDERAVRGVIDGCGHCFCFVCVLEWARVESRCPLCKSRFSSVRRLPKRGVFDGERVVPVPVRDQVA